MKSAHKYLLGTASAAALSSLVMTSASAVHIVDDSFLDGDQAKTGVPEALDTNWWTSSSSSGDEIAVGTLGLVTGSSGRGLHTIFAPQTLGVGDAIKATLDFTTPATVGVNRDNAFRLGLFDDLGRAGLDDHVSASSSSPNALYNILPGYMATMDVNLDVPADANINIREHDLGGTGSGRLLATTGNFGTVGSDAGAPYTFAADTDYVAMITVTKLSATDTEITVSLSDAGGVLSTHTVVDDSGSSDTFGMLAFHANSRTFGSSNSAGDPDNGLDFSRIQVEVLPVPEPSTAVLGLLGGLALIGKRRKA